MLPLSSERRSTLENGAVLEHRAYILLVCRCIFVPRRRRQCKEVKRKRKGEKGWVRNRSREQQKKRRENRKSAKRNTHGNERRHTTDQTCIVQKRHVSSCTPDCCQTRRGRVFPNQFFVTRRCCFAGQRLCRPHLPKFVCVRCADSRCFYDVCLFHSRQTLRDRFLG